MSREFSLYAVSGAITLIGFVTVYHFKGFDDAMTNLGNFLMLAGFGTFVATFLKIKTGG